jgi:hypothetical protein
MVFSEYLKTFYQKAQNRKPKRKKCKRKITKQISILKTHISVRVPNKKKKPKKEYIR